MVSQNSASRSPPKAPHFSALLLPIWRLWRSQLPMLPAKPHRRPPDPHCCHLSVVPISNAGSSVRTCCSALRLLPCKFPVTFCVPARLSGTQFNEAPPVGGGAAVTGLITLHILSVSHVCFAAKRPTPDTEEQPLRWRDGEGRRRQWENWNEALQSQLDGFRGA